MHRVRGNPTKDIYGAPVRRSEFDDELLRNNHRAGNRLGKEIELVNRAQRVIMKDLGKEATMLRNKIENERKTSAPLGLFGTRYGSATPRRYTVSSYTTSNGSYTTANGRPFSERTLKPLYRSAYQWNEVDRFDRRLRLGREKTDSVLSTENNLHSRNKDTTNEFPDYIATPRLASNKIRVRIPDTDSVQPLTQEKSADDNTSTEAEKIPETAEKDKIVEKKPKSGRKISRRKRTNPRSQSATPSSSIIDAVRAVQIT